MKLFGFFLKREQGTRRAECPSLPAPRYCARVRHSAEANHANDAGGVRNKSGFRPTGLNDEIESVRRGFISLRKSPNEQTASGSGSLLLRKEDRASRVQPRNPAYRSNISQNDEMKESGTRRAECPSLPAPRYCARVRHSAEANHAINTGGVRNRSGFRPTRLRRSEPCDRYRWSAPHETGRRRRYEII